MEMTPPPGKKGARIGKHLLLCLQLLVSVGMLAWIFHDHKFRADVWNVVASGHLEWLALGLLVSGVGNVIAAFRWRIFLHMLQMPLTIVDTLRLSFVGLFFNNFLPGAVGGDAVKVVWLVTKGYKDSSALVSVFMDRMSGFFAMVICSLALILSHYSWLTASAKGAFVTKSVFIFLASMAFLLTLSFVLAAPAVRKRVPHWLPLREKTLAFNADYFEFVVRWRETMKASLLSAFILFCHFFSFYCSAQAFNVRLPVMEFLALMPAVDIFSAIPISFGGFGVREKLLQDLLAELGGISASQAVSVSLGGAVLNMAWGLVGIGLVPSYRQLAARAQKA